MNPEAFAFAKPSTSAAVDLNFPFVSDQQSRFLSESIVASPGNSTRLWWNFAS